MAPGQTVRDGSESVVLIGPRGAGKSTLGPVLAATLGFGHVDSDDLISATVGEPVGAFLTRVGEPRFREVEVDLVGHALDANCRRVLSLGGGAVLREETRDRLRHLRHFVVFLSAPIHVLAERVLGASGRPSLTDLPPEQEIAALFAARLPLYRATCDLELDTFSTDAHGCARAVVANMGAPSD